MIFGAHLMPFSWLYDSKSYLVFSIIIPIAVLIIGLLFSPWVLAAFMIAVEVIFSLCLHAECKRL